MQLLKQSKIKMKKLVIHIALILFFSINCFCQLDKAAILDKKIKSIKQITYQNADSAAKDIVQIIYGIRGNDSLELYNGVLSFKYVGEFDDKGRLSQLVRYDEKEEEDERHIYKYNPEGSYSIEIIAQDSGTVHFEKYDKRNLLMEEVTEFGRAVYQRDASGKIEKIFFTEEHKKTEVIDVYYYDKNGILVNGKNKTKGGKAMYIRNNDNGLIGEMKIVSEEEADKEQGETTLFEYEFYK